MHSLTGRAAAALAVTEVLTGKQFVSEALRSFRMAGRLAPREAGLAMQIALGTVRHLLTIEHVLQALARFTPEQTKPRLRAILYTAVYQIVWMDRVPPFAAVDEAVKLARELVHGRTPGMANAILRRVAAAIVERRCPWQRLDAGMLRVSWAEACRFDRAVLPLAEAVAQEEAQSEAPHADASAATNRLTTAESEAGSANLWFAEHLAAATGERGERFAELVERFGVAAGEAVAWASQAVPVTVLQRNTLRIGADELRERLLAAFGDTVEFAADAAFVPARTTIMEQPAWSEGLVYVQDTTAHAAAAALRAAPGERVLDFCAAPGGKTVALALRMGDRGAIVACDVDAARLAQVAENAARLGLTCIRTQPLSGSGGDLADEAAFDAALVDVPCSNTGVIARRPEARLGLTPQKVRSLVNLQGELLRQAARHVRPGGRLVYSTCSIEPRENQQVVTDFLDELADWELDRQEERRPAWGPRLADWRDGGYWARLVRRG